MPSTAAAQRQRRADRRAKGRCIDCGADARGRARCDRGRAADAARHAPTYSQAYVDSLLRVIRDLQDRVQALEPYEWQAKHLAHQLHILEANGGP